MGESGFLDVEGGTIYYEVEGEGHPLLLTHGGLGTLRMRDEQVPAFSERYRVIRYDTRGDGLTETDDVEYSNHGDAAAMLDHVGAASAYVVGQSRGGIIALDLAIDRPERIDAFVSVASGIGGYKPPVLDDITTPPWDEMERLWESKEWERLAELDLETWVDGWGQVPTRVDAKLRWKMHDWILSALRQDKPEESHDPWTRPRSSAFTRFARRRW
jgi:pimeloyl-ACP methyl ester carboxylesterase